MDFLSEVCQGNVAQVIEFLKSDPTIALWTDRNKWTLLHYISAQGVNSSSSHAVIANLLIKAGADPNAQTILGWTPLHMIASNGSVESVPVARVLLESGADLQATTRDGMSWQMFWQHGQEIYDFLSSYETPNTRLNSGTDEVGS